MRATTHSWPVVAAALTTLLVVGSPLAVPDPVVIALLTVFWAVASVGLHDEWADVADPVRMLHLSGGALLGSAIVLLTSAEVTGSSGMVVVRVTLILAGPLLLFFAHGVHRVARQGRRRFRREDVLDATAHLLPPLALATTVAWPLVSAPTVSFEDRLTLAAMAVLASIVFLGGVLVVIGRPVGGARLTFLAASVMTLGLLGWLSTLLWIRDQGFDLLFPRLLIVPGLLYLIAVERGELHSVGAVSGRPSRPATGGDHGRQQRWVVYAALGLATMILAVVAASPIPMLFAASIGGVAVTRMAIQSSRLVRSYRVADLFDTLTSELSDGGDVDAVLEQTARAARTLLGDDADVRIASSDHRLPDEQNGWGPDKRDRATAVLSRNGVVQVFTSHAVSSDQIRAVRYLANLTELALGAGRRSTLPDLIESGNSSDPAISVTPSSGETPRKAVGPDTVSGEPAPEAAPSDPVWSDRDGSEEVRLIVEDGTVVESHGPASERLGYDPTNTDASSLLEAAFTGEAIPHAHRSGIWLNVATDPESESESLVITVHEPGMGRPVDRIDHHSGLPNLNDFELQGQLSGVVVIVFHLHDLERVRDSVGSEAGDSFVRRLASRARRSFRERHDRIWRGDGSKLIVMTPIESRGEGVRSKHGTAPLNNDHRSWIEARRLSLSTPTALGMSFIAPAISAGFTVVDKPIPAIEALQQAEMALMYARDNQPRSTVEYTSELHARMAWEWQIESYLAASLDDLGGAGFSVHYQPIVEASTGLVKVVEGLCRWRHPELGSVSPTEFIPIAERTGVIARIDDFVLAQAIGDVDRFRAVDPDIVVQVNMSPSGLKAERLAETAKTILRHLGGDHPGITIEITESALTDQPVADLAEVFAFLREGNIGISLDDFGTGESNFERLSRLPFTQVKLAHDFVRSNDVVLVSNVVQLVHGLGMKCVVEGVETTAQYEVAVAGGGDLIQGWIFARAMPRDDALHYTQIRRESILAGDDKQRAALTTDLGPGPVSSTGVTSNPGQQAALLRGHDPTGDDHKNPAGQ